MPIPIAEASGTHEAGTVTSLILEKENQNSEAIRELCRDHQLVTELGYEPEWKLRVSPVFCETASHDCPQAACFQPASFPTPFIFTN